MTEYSDCRLARRQTVLCEQIGNRRIRRALLPQFRDDILRRKQVLELLRTARREFINRFANCGWIK
jgi:hypothetical protein